MPTTSGTGGAGKPLPDAVDERALAGVGAGGALCELPGVVDGARLADDGDLDLARVLELVLDAARDVLRQPDRFLVGDRSRSRP